MNDSRKFENVLDVCLDRVLLKNDSVEQCLKNYPEYAGRLKPLLETALAARNASAIQPNPEFRTKARYQFQAALSQAVLAPAQKQSRPSFNLGWQPRWVVATASLLIFSMLGGTTVVAARASMPDSPLYAVKQATERVQMVFTFSNLGKAELNATLADKRVEEIVYLSDKDEPEKLAQTTESLNIHLNELSEHASSPGAAVVSLTGIREAAPAASPVTPPAVAPAPSPEPEIQLAKPAPVTAEPPVAVQAPEAKSEAAGKATTNETLSLAAAANVSERQQNDEQQKKRGSSDEDRRSKLKATVENQADNNIARLKATVENAPESAKPALQRALNISEDEYKKAIESLKNRDD